MTIIGFLSRLWKKLQSTLRYASPMTGELRSIAPPQYDIRAAKWAAYVEGVNKR